jgi:hypothetical protein
MEKLVSKYTQMIAGRDPQLSDIATLVQLYKTKGIGAFSSALFELTTPPAPPAATSTANSAAQPEKSTQPSTTPAPTTAATPAAK